MLAYIFLVFQYQDHRLLPINRSKSESRPKRILIVRTDRLGDVVLTLPVLPLLRSCYPDAHLAMLLNRYTGEIVEGNPYLNELIWYDRGGEPVPFREMCRELRTGRFDAAVVVYPRFRLACLMACAGIPIRVGTGYRYYSVLFNRRVFEHRRVAAKHEAEYNIGLIRELGCTASGAPEFRIEIPEEARKAVRPYVVAAHGKNIVVLHPGSGGSAREWPASSFGALAKTLLKRGDVEILVTGTGIEQQAVEHVVSMAGGKPVSLLGKLAVKELAALLESASLFVGNSTGPIHIAAAVGTPVVGLYPQHAAMSARRWGPWTLKKHVFAPDKPGDCKDCQAVHTACECMSSIPVDHVVTAANDLLERYGRSIVRAGEGAA